MISKELFCKTIADIQEDVARIPPHLCGGEIATHFRLHKRASRIKLRYKVVTSNGCCKAKSRNTI